MDGPAADFDDWQCTASPMQCARALDLRRPWRLNRQDMRFLSERNVAKILNDLRVLRDRNRIFEELVTFS